MGAVHPPQIGRQKIAGGGTVTTRGDAKLAMAFLVLGLGADKPVSIDDGAAVAEMFPDSPLAPEAAWRAADILWQMQKADVSSRPSAHEKESWMREQLDDEEMKKIIKFYPQTRQAAMAAYALIDNKLCGDWLGKPDCPEKETNIYEEYVKNHPNSPKVQEALLKAASRQAALIQIYATEEQPGKIPAAKQRAATLAKRAFDAKPDTDDAQRAQRLLYMVEHDIATYGNAID